jgi:predicted DCC family thiol-disulfide oxidoreductase YuxK
MSMSISPAIVLIDGDCTLCNRTMIWFSARNQNKHFIFAKNAGEVARILGEPPGGDHDTVVVWFGSRRLVRSEAVIYLLSKSDGLWPGVGLSLKIIPRAIRDFFYDLVARSRHRLNLSKVCPCLSHDDLAE